MPRIAISLFISLLLISCNEKFRIDYGNIISSAEVFVPVPFTSVWKVGTPAFGDGDLTVTLPLVTGFIYDFTVDWGDGTPISTVTSFNDANIDHSYAVPGDYTITILGIMEAWRFADSGDDGKIISVTDLGNTRALNLSYAFDGCENLTTFSGGNTSKVTSMQRMFSYSALTTIDVSSFDTSNVIQMGSMFASVESLPSLDLTSFDTSKVTDMSFMFENSWSLTTLDVSSFNTSAVTNMNGMFSTTQGLTILDVTSFDTSNVINMGDMFLYVDNVTTLDVSSFDTSNVTNMSGMFYHMINLTSLDVSNFDTSSATDVSWMFASTWDLVTLDATDWDISAVTNSVNIYGGGNPALVVTCNQGGPPASGALFGEVCF